MLSDVSENENIEPMSRSNTDKEVGDSSMVSGDKTVDIINSLEVQVMKKDGNTLLILILRILKKETSIG